MERFFFGGGGGNDVEKVNVLFLSPTLQPEMIAKNSDNFIACN